MAWAIEFVGGAGAGRLHVQRPLRAADAAAHCGLELDQPCAGPGRCSGCRVRFVGGAPPAGDPDVELAGDPRYIEALAEAMAFPGPESS